MNEDKIQQNRRNEDEKSTQERAAILGLQYMDLRDLENKMPLVPSVMNNDTMHKNRIIPIEVQREAQTWNFGITTLTPQSFVVDLQKTYEEQGKTAQIFLISGSCFQVLMTRYDPPKVVAYDNIKIAKAGDSATLSQVSETLNAVGSDKVFDFLVEQADLIGASDIHIENQLNGIRIRMRIDGALHPVAELNSDRYRVILGALGSRANISTAATEPQSGHMQKEITRDGVTHMLNLRVETVPTMYGQDAVLRLFNFDESMLNLDNLRLGASERAEIDEVISHPRGMVLAVGPTGSGKSTTLYSIINALNTTDRKIITLEDPIEFGVPGVTQIPIDTTNGQSFADGLRSVLRQDPDVVMVGEIRDADTAKTAIQASITGHLVLSSFHAIDTASAFSRMIDLIGVNPIFSTAIRLVIAQRLVRRLDYTTKQEYEPDEATKKWVQMVLQNLPTHIEKPDLVNFKLWKPVVSAASPFGFTGRVVIMEQMVVTDEIQKFLRGDIKDVNADAIANAARAGGMVTLLERGVLAALRGETTLDEINRVI